MQRRKAVLFLVLLLATVVTVLFAPSSAFASASWHLALNAGPYQQFKGVSATATNDVWAVGTYNPTPTSSLQTLTEHWNGTAWSLVPSPVVGTVDDELYSVAAIAANDAWAVGYSMETSGNFKALIEHWNGTAWSLVSGPPIAATIFYSVAASSSSDVWISGQYADAKGNSLPLIIHWDGAQWSIVASQLFANDTYGGVNSLAVLSPNDVWAVGTHNTLGYPVSAFATHWNGHAWSYVPVGGSLDLGSISATSDTNAWTVGYGNDSTSNVIEHWDGNHWVFVPNLTLPNLELNAIHAITSTNVWAVGSYDSNSGQQAIIEHWDGTTWTASDSPTVNDPLFAITRVPHTGQLWSVGWGAIERYH